MFKVHVISDLDYGFNEETDPKDNVIPDVDLVIINGNIGVLKRSVLYAHELAKKYPHVPMVFNFGELERYWHLIPKFEYEVEENIRVRINNNKTWPKNLYWKDSRVDDGILITLPNGQMVNVFTAYGFPKINSYSGDWEDTNWYRNYSVEELTKNDIEKWDKKPKEASYVSHGSLPIWATPDWINKKFEETQRQIKNWELNLKNFGILVTHLNPYNDPRFANCSVSPYLVHLNNGLWVASKNRVSNINYLGAKLYSNPGRGALARSQIIEVDGSNRI